MTAITALQSQVDSARTDCPHLQLDSELNNLAVRANVETHSYIEHTARFIPFEDPTPILRSMGYAMSKAKLLAGYGELQEQAIEGVLVFGWEAISDCSYTRYGVDVLSGDAYTLATVVLAGGG